ncbi:tryptophan-rich sensory protein [Sulfitobacter pacificus]|uniref:Seryl-tRNA synthetase n=1 Tax=Sulfitobacter pacificus TaxID=1499314 RepID=A0ABQ5VGJ4_9RHOB|nr:tryptophan-rich sensory protein [Sulfitobacter pacificus]GLQ26187.1 seryl-tRNA synthetase [Sulfitobacter pacificus]
MLNARFAFALACFLLSLLFAASPLFVEGFAGFDPNQFPVPQDNPPVQPAGYAFAIWGVIYGWLILGMGWGLLRAHHDGQWHDMRKPLAVSLLVGTVWLAVAVASPVWASLLIWVMLLAALAALFLAPVNDQTWAAWPVGLYAGWLSAASCVSLGLLTAGYGFLDQNTAAIIFTGLAIIIGGFVQSALGRAPTYGIAVIWALVAIVVANLETAPMIAYIAGGGALVMLVPTLKAFRAM